MKYRYSDDDRTVYDEKKKKFYIGSVLKWTVYIVCIFILATVIFRLITTGEPKELKNYIIKSGSVQRAYAEHKDALLIYSISVRNPFAVGDTFFLDNVYYIENAGNFQLTLRSKNSRTEKTERENFGYWLKVSKINTENTENPENEYDISDISEPVYAGYFEKNTARYNYLVMSFDNVEIDYANTKIELYIIGRTRDVYTEEDAIEDAIARFTIFDVNTPKSKVQAKIFDLG